MICWSSSFQLALAVESKSPLRYFPWSCMVSLADSAAWAAKTGFWVEFSQVKQLERGVVTIIVIDRNLGKSLRGSIIKLLVPYLEQWIFLDCNHEEIYNIPISVHHSALDGRIWWYPVGFWTIRSSPLMLSIYLIQSNNIWGYSLDGRYPWMSLYTLQVGDMSDWVNINNFSS